MKQLFDEGRPGEALLLRDLYSCSVFNSRSAAKEMLKISLLFSNLLNMLNMWWKKTPSFIRGKKPLYLETVHCQKISRGAFPDQKKDRECIHEVQHAYQ